MTQDRKFSRILNISMTVGVTIFFVLVALFNPKKEQLQAQELSCKVICEGQESYIEPKYYPEGFDVAVEGIRLIGSTDPGKYPLLYISGTHIQDELADYNSLGFSQEYHLSEGDSFVYGEFDVLGIRVARWENSN